MKVILQFGVLLFHQKYEISDFHFVTEQSAVKNLLNEGIDQGSIFFVGNTMIDSLVETLLLAIFLPIAVYKIWRFYTKVRKLATEPMTSNIREISKRNRFCFS